MIFFPRFSMNLFALALWCAWRVWLDECQMSPAGPAAAEEGGHGYRRLWQPCYLYWVVHFRCPKPCRETSPEARGRKDD